ncbi:zinc finger protein ush-like isoform X2 [Paramacrobiotus metropolitanus]|nr:zinc finger protein ush-like isoform X2 [Paramacrobiotus metropolitanus]XP_055344888.1 zinc finger protein ush-like isoform X2 [Paramacrobiotus metropolitanus]
MTTADSDDLPLDLSIKRHSTPSISSTSSEIVQLLTRDKHRRHPCLTCGIGFSSLKTLHAHLQFYCATKPTTDTLTTPSTTETPSVKSEPVTERSVTPTSTTASQSAPAETKSPVLSGHFCSFCAFRANTPRGLRSHVTKYHFKEAKNVPTPREGGRPRAHRQSVIVSAKRPKLVAQTTIAAVPEKRKYCKYCDIYFKYLSTFLAHRKFYCTVRKQPGDEPLPIAKAAAPAPTISETFKA